MSAAVCYRGGMPTRTLNYTVLSWDAAHPRATFRLDGYYTRLLTAQEIATFEQGQGRRTLVLQQVGGEAFCPIPDGLFARQKDL